MAHQTRQELIDNEKKCVEYFTKHKDFQGLLLTINIGISNRQKWIQEDLIKLHRLLHDNADTTNLNSLKEIFPLSVSISTNVEGIEACNKIKDCINT